MVFDLKSAAWVCQPSYLLPMLLSAKISLLGGCGSQQPMQPKGNDLASTVAFDPERCDRPGQLLTKPWRQQVGRQLAPTDFLTVVAQAGKGLWLAECQSDQQDQRASSVVLVGFIQFAKVTTTPAARRGSWQTEVNGERRVLLNPGYRGICLSSSTEDPDPCYVSVSPNRAARAKCTNNCLFTNTYEAELRDSQREILDFGKVTWLRNGARPVGFSASR